MANTIEKFRAEYGIRLDTLAQVTGISEETLAGCENVLPVPPQIAQIIIEKYNLPQYYFTELSAEERIDNAPKTWKNFIVPSFVWLLATSVIMSLPSFVGSMMISLSTVISRSAYLSNAAVHSGVTTWISLFNIVWSVAVIIFSCNFFSKWIEKKFGFSADKRKFKYLYWIVPIGMTGTVYYIISNIFYNDSIISVRGALMFLCSVVGEIIGFVLLAFMLNAVLSYGEKDRRLLKFFYIFFGANAALKALVAVLFDIIHGVFPINCYSIVIKAIIAVLLAVYLAKEEKSPLDKTTRFTALPLACIIVPNVVGLIKTLIGIVNTVI